MHVHQLVHAARATAAAACVLLVFAASAAAMPADNIPHRPRGSATATPTVVRETVVRPADGPGTAAFVVLGLGAVAALLGAGYLGARIATRSTRASRLT
jgi:hypothetical protein